MSEPSTLVMVMMQNLKGDTFCFNLEHMVYFKQDYSNKEHTLICFTGTDNYETVPRSIGEVAAIIGKTVEMAIECKEHFGTGCYDKPDDVDFEMPESNN